MSCQEVCEFLDAYLDEELDVVTGSRFERHLSECAACREQYDNYQKIHESVKRQLEYFRTPQAFEQKLRTQLDRSGRQPREFAGREQFSRWRAWAMAASIVAVLLLAGLLFQVARRSPASDMLAAQVVASHIRSLQANHLNDVMSTDQHTVKPWFSGKLDFAPVVKDLTARGFPLTGGRLDYLDDRTVAALVYKRRQHAINLFEWPAPSSDFAPRTLTVRGYTIVHWSHSHMAYWAVSDVNADDLREFARDVEN